MVAKLCTYCHASFEVDHNRPVVCSLACAFWRYVEIIPESCRKWLGLRDDQGYGVVYYGGTTFKAHRASLLIAGVRIDGLHVLHHCDSPPCTNPDHLFVGTQADNVRDMDNKRRRVALNGEDAGRAKLSSMEAAAIRSALSDGEKCTVLGRRFGVTSNAISAIKFNKSWRSLKCRSV